MTGFAFDIVGFDLDGTLFDTSADLAGALNHALQQLGRPDLPLPKVKTLIGQGTRHMLALGLEATGGCTPDLLNRSYPALMRFYEAHLTMQTEPYPGLAEALEALMSAGVALAVVTNKAERLATELLEAMGVAHAFATVIGGDSLGPGTAKPSPVPLFEMIKRCGGGRAAFVGDSRFDIEAARSAGVPSIAVSFGFLGDGVHALGANAVIDHFVELVPTLVRLGEPNHRSIA
ncbi:HAD-IA family hydrolase [Sphingomonas sp. S2-65]|uniref:HAD-IA family hydrolase n=1 Tax=Sphingomonas sp. S2-65 TaxID=2903960 RepID=UPI001F24013F|nr:HAD-IA family hydrolase [Sphingomonas sp. S2-65]UYY58514.1 HAD-IA family hydrolase [Sphingomonas sp. S2-65]